MLALALGIGMNGPAFAQGFLDNTATAIGDANGTRMVDDSGARVQLAAPVRAVAATCTASMIDDDGVPGMSAGDTLLATITVVNAATAPVEGVMVALERGVNLPLREGDDGDRRLEVDETWRYAASRPIGQDVIDTDGGGTGLISIPGSAGANGADPADFTCELPIDRRPALDLLKVADTDTLAGSPSVVTYRFTVTNTGNVTLRDVAVRDDKLVPAVETCPVLPVGETCTQARTYAPTPAELAGSPVTNSATASAPDLDGTAVSASSSVTTVLAPPDRISVAKSAVPRTVRRGETALFTITVTNDDDAPRDGLRVIDRLPPGLAYVAGSMTLDGLRVPAAASGPRIDVGPVRVAGEGSVTLTFRASVTAAAVPGALVNRVEIADARTGRTLARDTARVDLAPEPVLDCADVLGRVFADANRNGVQDDGERGIAGARVATVRGLVVTSDEFGRFSIPCAALPAGAIGSNFILKLDEDSLPRGAAVLTENPRVIRLTPGRVARVFFGVTTLRDIEVQVSDAAFLSGRANLSPDWRVQLDGLIEVLRTDPSTLRLTYRGVPSERGLAEERLRTLARTVSVLWRRAGEPYALEIERRALLE